MEEEGGGRKGVCKTGKRGKGKGREEGGGGRKG